MSRVVAFLLLLNWAPLAFGVVDPEENPALRRPQHVPGRLIVKLTRQANQELTPLKKLSRQYRVKDWKPLFPSTGTEDPTGLNRIYLLTCDPAVDVRAASSAFSALKEYVEYAEPDFIARIQVEK